MTRRIDGKSPTRVDWLTPPEVIDRVRLIGPIVLDPCANSKHRNHTGATYCLTKDDGIPVHADAWEAAIGGEVLAEGITYCNPPWRHHTRAWIAQCIALNASVGARVIALVPANVDSSWWGDAYATASAVCYWRGRMRFLDPVHRIAAEHGAGAPVAVFAWGDIGYRFCEVFRGVGTVQVLGGMRLCA